MALFEFQGEFEHTSVDEFDGLVLGQLADKPNGDVEILCGNQQIRGKLHKS